MDVFPFLNFASNSLLFLNRIDITYFIFEQDKQNGLFIHFSVKKNQHP